MSSIAARSNVSRASGARARGPSITGVLKHLIPPLLVFLFFAAAGVVHVTSRVLVVDAGYRLSRLENEQRTLSREHARLKLELATLKSPARLEQLARTKLGMVPPAPGSVLTPGHALPPSANTPSANTPSANTPSANTPSAGTQGAPTSQRSAP